MNRTLSEMKPNYIDNSFVISPVASLFYKVIGGGMSETEKVWGEKGMSLDYFWPITPMLLHESVNGNLKMLNAYQSVKE